MFEIERHSFICRELDEKGKIKTTEAAKALGVTHETVRKDILFLEKKGFLVRTHGGAVAVHDGKMVELKSLKNRLDDFPELKKEAAENAVSFINEGDVIAIDAGTTAIYIADLLAERFCNLTVVTYCMSTFERLRGVKDFKIILTGGEFIPAENAFTGHLTMNTLSKLHVMKSFVLPAAVSVQNGISYMHKEFVESVGRLVEMADKVFVVADSSKYEQYALYKVSEAEKKFTYITDSGLSHEIVKRYEKEGLKLVGAK